MHGEVGKRIEPVEISHDRRRLSSAAMAASAIFFCLSRSLSTWVC
jgi:hypothetical protein